MDRLIEDPVIVFFGVDVDGQLREVDVCDLRGRQQVEQRLEALVALEVHDLFKDRSVGPARGSGVALVEGGDQLDGASAVVAERGQLSQRSGGQIRLICQSEEHRVEIGFPLPGSSDPRLE